MQETTLMAFENAVEGIEDLDNRNEVGLALYILQSYEGEESVPISELADFLQLYGSSMSESAISAHIQNLSEQDIVHLRERQFEDEYFLSPTGMRRYERITGDSLTAPPPEEVNPEQIEERYEELYLQYQNIKEELEEQNTQMGQWRKRTWIWRIVAFLTGIIITLILQILI